jgi:cell division protein FtsL
MTAPSIPLRHPAPPRPAAPPRVEHRPRLRPWIVFTLAVIVAFFGLTYSRISLDRTAFELEDLDKQIAQEERRLLDLRVDLARLQDPARIDALAAEMGLVYPAARVTLEAPEITAAEIAPDLRWAHIEALLSAQP